MKNTEVIISDLFGNLFSRNKLLSLFTILIVTGLLSTLNLKGAIIVSSIPLVFIIIFNVFNSPIRILFLALSFSFVISGLSRYIKFSWGLGIDIFLVLGWIILFFREYKNLNLNHLKNDFFGLSLFWMSYVVFLIINPESHSLEAWFYAMRGVGFYFLLVLGLGLMTLRHYSHLDYFLNTIILLSVLGSIWAIKQKYIGIDSFEYKWLWVDGHYDEHVLFGVLRAFSFYSDAGQFGASQIMISMICAILILQKKLSLSKRTFYLIGFILTFIGFALSGSRGPMIIPVIGGFTFLILSKNFKLLILGLTVLASSFIVLKYTYVAHSIEQVRRFRTALAPDNPSLNARLRNQKIFAEHLKSRPLGGGIGSAGYWGNRFSPNTLLASTPTDSYYVKVWAETGIIGVSLHSLILGYLMGRCVCIINTIRNINLKFKALALFSAVFGVLVASYGNQIFSQLPTGIIMAMSIGLLYLMPIYDSQLFTKT